MTTKFARRGLPLLLRAGSALLAASTALWIPASGQAQTARQERRSPLADAPAIRSRVELRDKRFELGIGGGSTLGQDFFHAVLVGPRLSFHLNDVLAITAVGGFNVSPDFKTTFHEELVARLPMARGMDRTPTQQEALDGMNRISMLFGVGAELTPFAGKLSLFGAVFAHYDMYLFGGIGGVNFQQAGDKEPCPDNVKQNSCPVVGMKFGPSIGLGAHAFINDFVALDLSLRDYWVKNNPAGRDENGDTIANKFDHRWDQNFVLGLNVTFFLPAQPRLTD